MIFCKNAIMSTFLIVNIAMRVNGFRIFPSKILQRGGGVFSNYLSSTTSLSGYTILDPPTSSASNNKNTERNLQSVLHTAEKAAHKAGEIMVQTSGKISISKTKANAADLVTESDLECQRIIKEIVKSECPEDYFLGEEDVEAGSFASSTALENALRRSPSDEDNEMRESKLLWVVDPIDGTTNFQAGLPMFCVSIGVVLLEPDEEPEVIAGVIYNPVLDEMVSAVRGRGCYVNGKRLHNNFDDRAKKLDYDEAGLSLDKALVNVGFPVYSEGTLRASSRAVTALATKVRGLRMIASASQVMSWVAQGKLNAYVSWDLNAWDIAAGMIIVEESGGFISDFEGNRGSILTRDMIISCNEGNSKHELSKAILQVLKENDCLQY